MVSRIKQVHIIEMIDIEVVFSVKQASCAARGFLSLSPILEASCVDGITGMDICLVLVTCDT